MRVRERRLSRFANFNLAGEVCKARLRIKRLKSWERRYETKLLWDADLLRFVPVYIACE